MKPFFILILLGMANLAIYAQDPVPAAKGVIYGAGATAEGAIRVNDLEKNLKKDRYEGKVTGKVTDVCLERGCWMKVEKANGEKMMVKFKDYGFFMPRNIVGKEVVLDGEATINTVSVKQQQHYAKDAGKSEEEAGKITKPKRELQFVAKGVLVL